MPIRSPAPDGFSCRADHMGDTPDDFRRQRRQHDWFACLCLQRWGINDCCIDGQRSHICGLSISSRSIGKDRHGRRCHDDGVSRLPRGIQRGQHFESLLGVEQRIQDDAQRGGSRPPVCDARYDALSPDRVTLLARAVILVAGMVIPEAAREAVLARVTEEMVAPLEASHGAGEGMDG